jgi:hypothetical protein
MIFIVLKTHLHALLTLMTTNQDLLALLLPIILQATNLFFPEKQSIAKKTN